MRMLASVLCACLVKTRGQSIAHQDLRLYIRFALGSLPNEQRFVLLGGSVEVNSIVWVPGVIRCVDTKSYTICVNLDTSLSGVRERPHC